MDVEFEVEANNCRGFLYKRSYLVNLGWLETPTLASIMGMNGHQIVARVKRIALVVCSCFDIQTKFITDTLPPKESSVSDSN